MKQERISELNLPSIPIYHSSFHTSELPTNIQIPFLSIKQYEKLNSTIAPGVFQLLMGVQSTQLNES